MPYRVAREEVGQTLSNRPRVLDHHQVKYCVLTSPELYHLLTVEMGWRADRHQEWVTELMKSDLLGAEPDLS